MHWKIHSEAWATKNQYISSRCTWCDLSLPLSFLSRGFPYFGHLPSDQRGREGGSPHKFSVKIRFPLYRTEERRNSPTPSPRPKSGDARRRSGTNRVVQIPSLPFKSCCPIVHVQTDKNAREKIYEENGKPFYEVCSSVRSRKYFFANLFDKIH